MNELVSLLLVGGKVLVECVVGGSAPQHDSGLVFEKATGLVACDAACHR